MLIFYFIIALIITGLLFFTKKHSLQVLLLVIFNILQCGITIYECLHFHTPELGYFNPDAAAIIMLIILNLLSVASSYHSVDYLKQHTSSARARSIYYSALCLLVIAQTAAFLSSHIAITWVFIEITTFSAAILIFHERSEYALEAAWKYLFVCSVAIAFAFIGILLLTMSVEDAGVGNLSYSTLIANAASYNPFWLKLSFLFILTGYSAKMGLFPMHTVCIDAHTVAPPPISAFISTTLMNVGFIAIFRMYSVIASTTDVFWANNILIFAGALSVFVATVYLLRVNHLKRMAAYSSLEYMGLVAICLGVGGIGYVAAFLLIIFHSFTKASLFYQLQQVYKLYKSYMIKDTGNYFKYNTPGAIAIFLVFICLTAMPPSGMFISEFMLFKAIFASHSILLLLFILLLLSFIIWALAKNFLKLLFHPTADFNEVDIVKISPWHSVTQFILIGLVFYLGLNPPALLMNLINEAIIILPH
ncbi:MAG: hypothetical protein KA792_06920 [Bacteroidales bacterium]|nr:hypothetical protein [Bacteroidales bacterium]